MGFACSPEHHWVRINWPTILTDHANPTRVWFRARLYRYARRGWKPVHRSRWHVGVSNNQQRFLLGSSFGLLPYPFVGACGHYFAYLTRHGSYAAPQLGPL